MNRRSRFSVLAVLGSCSVLSSWFGFWVHWAAGPLGLGPEPGVFAVEYTEPMSLVAVTSAPLDLQALTAEMAGSGTGDGAITAFTGLVRDHNQGRKVRFLVYEAYE